MGEKREGVKSCERFLLMLCICCRSGWDERGYTQHGGHQSRAQFWVCYETQHRHQKWWRLLHRLKWPPGELSGLLFYQNMESVSSIKSKHISSTILRVILTNFSLQIIKRIRYAKLPLQANYYPMPSQLFIQDPDTRFSILSAQPLGGTSLKSGQMEVRWQKLTCNIFSHVCIISSIHCTFLSPSISTTGRPFIWHQWLCMVSGDVGPSTEPGWSSWCGSRRPGQSPHTKRLQTCPWTSSQGQGLLSVVQASFTFTESFQETIQIHEKVLLLNLMQAMKKKMTDCR